jgi:transposase
MRTIIAGIDVHKKVLMVVVGEPGVPETRWSKVRFGTLSSELEPLKEWLAGQQVSEVVMESTAQYWKPVWMTLEGSVELHLAQARSNKGQPGRKTDFGDARRLVRRYRAGDLALSFVPEAGQRQQRMLARGRQQLIRERVRLQNHIESLLEEGQIKLSSVVSDVLGLSGRRILEALAGGETDAEVLAKLADRRLKAEPEQLRAALRGRWQVVHQRLLGMQLARLELIDKQIEQMEMALHEILKPHQEAIARLCEVPGLQSAAAGQILAETGPRAAAFPSEGHLASWVGSCPGREESAGHSRHNRCPKGNRTLRRVLTQVAWAAVKTKGSRFHALFHRLKCRLGAPKAIWAVVHRITRLVWLILHEGVRYRELGPLALDAKALQRRKNRLTKQLRALGFQVHLTPLAEAP